MVVAWTEIDIRHRLRSQFAVVGTVPRLVEPILVVQRLLVHERQDQHPPTVHRLAVFIGDVRWRKRAINVVVIVKR